MTGASLSPISAVKPLGDDHAVVFLGRKADTIVYYDPADHRVYHDKIANMRRGSPGESDTRN